MVEAVVEQGWEKGKLPQSQNPGGIKRRKISSGLIGAEGRRRVDWVHLLIFFMRFETIDKAKKENKTTIENVLCVTFLPLH